MINFLLETKNMSYGDCYKKKVGCGYKKPDHGYKVIKCGDTEIVYKKGSAHVKCVEKVTDISGFYLICGEKGIENTSCESSTIVKTERCLVVQIVQYEEHPRFGYLQILNVTDSCPILLQIVDTHKDDFCKKFKMIGAGGNGARTYEFEFKKVRCNKLKEFKYTFVQGFSNNVVGSVTSQLSATGHGSAHRVEEDDVGDLIAMFPEGQCEPL